MVAVSHDGRVSNPVVWDQGGCPKVRVGFASLLGPLVSPTICHIPLEIEYLVPSVTFCRGGQSSYRHCFVCNPSPAESWRRVSRKTLACAARSGLHWHLCVRHRKAECNSGHEKLRFGGSWLWFLGLVFRVFWLQWFSGLVFFGRRSGRGWGGGRGREGDWV